MKVWELMSWLSELPAGAAVRLQPHPNSNNCYEIVSVTDTTEDDAGSSVSVWINGDADPEETD